MIEGVGLQEQKGSNVSRIPKTSPKRNSEVSWWFSVGNVCLGFKVNNELQSEDLYYWLRECRRW